MLTGSRVVYLIVYVRDLEVSRRFYEQQLGMSVLEEDDDSAKYDCGELILCLNRASQYHVELPAGRDESAQIVFLVRDIDKVQAALEARSVEFPGTMKYEVGAIADFYDPDGHHLVLYEPSEEALAWPSGDKVKAVWAAQHQHALVPAQGNGRAPHSTAKTDLAGAPVIYLFMFVTDHDAALQFYHYGLGLEALEGGPCSRASGGDEEGVVKYDGGGLLLSTHHIDNGPEVPADGHVCPPRYFDPARAKGVAPVFHVSDIQHAVDDLSAKGVSFAGGIREPEIGKVASFCDPSGHQYFLYEPSAWALTRPSGEKIQRILVSQY